MSKNKREALATVLDGSEYPFRLSEGQVRAAMEEGLVVAYGASDDLMEFEGAIHDEVSAYEGTVARLDKEGLFPEWDDIGLSEAEAERYFRRKPNVREIKAIWNRDGYSWIYETDIPHATFEIMEDGEKYCRGIVFSIEDLTR